MKYNTRRAYNGCEIVVEYIEGKTFKATVYKPKEQSRVFIVSADTTDKAVDEVIKLLEGVGE